jgi:triacylglycerol lipase
MKNSGPWIILMGITVLALAGCAGTPAIPAPPDTTGEVPFSAIHRLSKMYRVMRYQKDPQILEAARKEYDEVVLVNLPSTENRYMVGTLNGARRQEIFIRGTANMRNVFSDLAYRPHHNERLGISIHTGFEKMALAVYQDILPRLNPEYDLVIFGHSLGAAEAVILAMLLDQDNRRVTQVYASGQPRVTDVEGEKKYDYLPILRIINEDDPVPFLPPRAIVSTSSPYMHIGNAVVILDGPYYCLLAEDTCDEALASDFWRTFSQEGPVVQVEEHFISSYLARLAPKLAGAVQVPYAQRYAYVAKGK